MRRVNKYKINRPDELDSQDCKDHLQLILANPLIKAKREFYRGTVELNNGLKEHRVVVALKGLYLNKCGYCEKSCHNPRVDHHRPANRVTGDQPSGGYYWLSYEWTNFVPSCQDCNSIEAKSDKFPINSGRKNNHPTSGVPAVIQYDEFKYSSIYNKSEEPLFLHPEYCYPHLHFDFDRHGKIIGTTQHGIRTISDLKLDNPDLNGWRRKIYEDHSAELNKIIRKRFRHEKKMTEEDFISEMEDFVLNLVLNSINPKLEYTLFRKILVKKMKYFFVETQEEKFQDEVNAAMINALILI